MSVLLGSASLLASETSNSTWLNFPLYTNCHKSWTTWGLCFSHPPLGTQATNSWGCCSGGKRRDPHTPTCSNACHFCLLLVDWICMNDFRRHRVLFNLSQKGGQKHRRVAWKLSPMDVVMGPQCSTTYIKNLMEEVRHEKSASSWPDPCEWMGGPCEVRWTRKLRVWKHYKRRSEQMRREKGKCLEKVRTAGRVGRGLRCQHHRCVQCALEAPFPRSKPHFTYELGP